MPIGVHLQKRQVYHHREPILVQQIRLLFSSSALLNVNRETIAAKCAEREFHGIIKSRTNDDKHVLAADEFMNILLEIKAIE